jgi:hypothetical protein
MQVTRESDSGDFLQGTTCVLCVKKSNGYDVIDMIIVYMVVTEVLQECYKSVARVLQECYKSITR